MTAQDRKGPQKDRKGPYKILLIFCLATFVCADTVDTFKNRLDKFWQDQEVLYNWKADICTGSRSQVNVILD